MDQDSQRNQPDPDSQLVSDFVCEMNITRRQLATYPAGHPMLNKTADKGIALLGRLFESHPELGFGVAREALMFRGKWLNRKNPCYRDFAAFLFSRGVASINFMRAIERDEFIRLHQLLRAERAEIQEHGGYPALLEAQRIFHIRIVPIDYRNFTTVEKERIASAEVDLERESLWENFLRALMNGALDPEGSSLIMPANFDPLLVASILNRITSKKSAPILDNYDAVITSFIGQKETGGSDVCEIAEKSPSKIKDLGKMICALNPELRHQFLNSTFRTLDRHQNRAEEILGSFPEELIVDSLNQVNLQQMKVSGNILNLLGKLANKQTGSPSGSTILGGNNLDKREADKRIRLIFQEEQSDKFIPAAYHQALKSVVSPELSPLLGTKEGEKLRSTLTHQSIERRTSAIAMEILSAGAETELESILQRNLIDLASFFLGTGDFSALSDLHQRWSDYLNRSSVATFLRDRDVFKTLHSPEFIIATLDELELFGQDKQKEIHDFILVVGSPFAEELIKRLAKNKSMKIRHYYMNCLKDMGPDAHEAIFEHLGDKRWYLVRNLVIILAQQKTPALVKKLSPLIDYPHPCVHQEVLKMMFAYNKPRAERHLREELLSKDIETQRAAVKIAHHSQSKIVTQLLVKILREAPLTEEKLELKILILQTLAKIGDDQVVTFLEGLLHSINLRHPKFLRRLKLEIVKTLSHYPKQSASPLLEKLARKTGGELATAATEQLRLLDRRTQ